MQFENSRTAFQALKEFPHMVYCAHLFGDWNTMVITDTQFDLTQLVGFKEMVFQGTRGVSYTAKADLASWRHCVYHVGDYLQKFQPKLTLTQRKVLPELPWGEKEWMLYSAFHDNVRKKITKTLQKIEVRYEEYREWKTGLDIYCTTHTGFYPQGYDSYAHHCFVVSTEYEPQVKRLFSLFPTTSFFMEVGQSLLIIVSVPNPQVTRWLYSVINVMKAEEMITHCSHAQFLLHRNLRG